tara:strand:+ start:453875 stop:454114 length:240 start_codon:yes stop_codon:yes gene_type:complete
MLQLAKVRALFRFPSLCYLLMTKLQIGLKSPVIVIKVIPMIKRYSLKTLFGYKSVRDIIKIIKAKIQTNPMVIKAIFFI